MEIIWRVVSRGAGEEWGEKIQGIRSINVRYKRVKNSTGNGEAKELTCATHGHEPKGGNAGGKGGIG